MTLWIKSYDFKKEILLAGFEWDFNFQSLSLSFKIWQLTGHQFPLCHARIGKQLLLAASYKTVPEHLQ